MEAAQRGLNAGVVYGTFFDPGFGSFLYLQDLTALNPYFQVTETRPDGAVGGEWPELGYRMPVNPDRPLRKGEEVALSDIHLHLSPETPGDERQSARLFLDLLAGIYTHLSLPPSEFHPWPERARETLRDLARSPKATIKEHGYVYLHPYTDSEYPDSMVQLTVLATLREYERWSGEKIEFADVLRAGVPNFFDIDLRAVRRYLPSVGDDKNADEVDSWYLYHPLASLARLALWGDDEAKALFLKSLPYAIKVARHFEYRWPIQFDVETLHVIKACRKPDGPGQSDVGGLYASVMLLAHELTGEDAYLAEARAGIEAARGMRFELCYQTNITSWGALACLKLWRLTGDPLFRDQSYVFIACLMHNCVLWNSEIKHASDYLHFMAVTCLHDGPYMAPFECYESAAAFHEYLAMGGDELPDSVRLLMSEYIRYAASRAWYFYPDQLPAEALAAEIRNGHIDRTLAFPLEDLYADGQPAGQVGQEIYGCGMAFAFAARYFHRLEGAPFLLYSEYPLADSATVENFRVLGAPGSTCRLRLIPDTEPLPPSTKLRCLRDKKCEEEILAQTSGEKGGADFLEFVAPVGVSLSLCRNADSTVQ